MNKERSSSEILLSLESKITHLTNKLDSQDFNIKMLLNKINSLVNKLEQVQKQPKIESVDETTFTEVDPENNIAMELTPGADRRGSRVIEDVKQSHQDEAVFQQKQPILPVQIPNFTPKPVKAKTMKTDNLAALPVEQRVVDNKSKSVFLANVEITNLETNELAYKGRTNSFGKWQAPLAHGKYRVNIIRTKEIGKNSEPVGQDIIVEGNSPITLQMLVIR